MRMKNHYTNNSHKNQYTNNFMIFFVVINQINQHKAKIYNQCKYTPMIIKKFHNYI